MRRAWLVAGFVMRCGGLETLRIATAAAHEGGVVDALCDALTRQRAVLVYEAGARPTTRCALANASTPRLEDVAAVASFAVETARQKGFASVVVGPARVRVDPAAVAAAKVSTGFYGGAVDDAASAPFALGWPPHVDVRANAALFRADALSNAALGACRDYGRAGGPRRDFSPAATLGGRLGECLSMKGLRPFDLGAAWAAFPNARARSARPTPSVAFVVLAPERNPRAVPFSLRRSGRPEPTRQ